MIINTQLVKKETPSSSMPEAIQETSQVVCNEGLPNVTVTEEEPTT